MRRVHIMLNTSNLEKSKEFYTALLGADPTKEKEDYVQWKIDNPALNLSLMSKASEKPGINHLGIETDDKQDLQKLFSNIQSTEDVIEEGNTTCCYARSKKSWATDPEGMKWEMFLSYGEADTYYEEHPEVKKQFKCCA